MSEIFSLKRFGKCLWADLERGASKFGVTLLVLSFLEVIVYLLGWLLKLILSSGGFTRFNEEVVSSSFTFFVCIIIIILAMPTSLYGHLTDRRAGADYLMVPASALEKFLSMILVCLIITPGIFVGVYTGCDALISALDPHFSSYLNSFYMKAFFTPAAVGRTINSFGNIFMMISTFLLGAIWFRRRKIVYTILALFVMASIFGLTLSFYVDSPADTATKSVDGWWAGANAVYEAVILVLCYLRIRTIQQ